ncbi:MAG: CARDB domain-containing protein, partial [candidate division WOR-3 bacterium]
MFRKILICIFICITLIASPVDDAINKGIEWLKLNQNPDSTWGEEYNNFLSTSEVLRALILNGEDSIFDIGLKRFMSFSLPSLDHISRYLEVVTPFFPDTTGLIDTILTFQNQDGGFGALRFYGSYPLDVSLLLRALNATNYSDYDRIGRIIYYIVNKQKDNYWCDINDSSSVYITALTLISLERFHGIYDLSTQIRNGISWLLSQQNTNGSFGKDTTSIYESALSLMALQHPVTADSSRLTAIEKTKNFLLSAQDSEGSWNNNAYETALAILALSTMSPNLVISSAWTDPSTIGDGQVFTLSAVIKNIGMEKADGFKVKFILDTLLLWEGVIDSLLPGDSTIVDFSYNLPSGRYEIKGTVDWENKIREGNEGDNEYVYHLNVFTPADLVVYPQDIKIEPIRPTEKDTIQVNFSVYNTGEMSVKNVKTAVYDGDPQNGGLLLVNFDFPVIGGGQFVSGRFLTMLPQGNHTLYVLADPDNIILESNETNNTATRSFNVTGFPPDLAVNNNDITFTPTSPEEGDSVKISAVIRNIGEGGAQGITVSFYEGNPNLGAKQIGSVFINFVLPGGSKKVDINWGTIGKEGYNDIWVVIDPENRIEEITKLNNIAHASIKVKPSEPDLEIKSKDIVLFPEYPTLLDTINILVWVHNRGSKSINETIRVNFYKKEATEENIIGFSHILKLMGKDSAQVKLNWVPDTFGLIRIYAKADPYDEIVEKNDRNNKAYKEVYVTFPEITELTLDSLDITFFPINPEISESVEINAEIHNISDIPANLVKVDFYDGNPNGGGTLIGSNVISKIFPFGSGKARITWSSNRGGPHSIFVVIDPDNLIMETSKENNTAGRGIWIGNRLPIISWSKENGFITDGVNPNTGDTNEIFEYRIVYTDIDNDPPMDGYPKVWVDLDGDGFYNNVVGGMKEGSFSMFPVDLSDNDYRDGKEYSYLTKLPLTLEANYRFEAKDIKGNLAKEEIGPLSSNEGPIVGSYPPRVNVMPEYPTWPGREIYVWGNVYDPNWREKNYFLIEKEEQWEVNFGTNTGLSGDDNYTLVNLPFEFEFYDSTFLEVYISTNGFIGFSSENNYSKSNASGFPNTEDKYVIAPFWTDLVMNDSSGIYYWYSGDKFIISWVNVSPKNNPDVEFIFQISLDKYGNIRFNYEKIDTTINATIGVNLGDGVEGRTYEGKPTSKTSLSLLERDYDKEIVEPHWEMDFGRNTGLSGDDEWVKVSLPFPFELYGSTFNEVYISTNGYVGFSDENDYTLSSCDSFPSVSFKYVLAPYLEDLYFEDDGGVYYLSTKVSDESDKKNSWDVFIISWVNAHLKGHPENSYTFQLVLTEKNEVRFSYYSINTLSSDSPLVGINKGDGVDGTLYPVHPISERSIEFPKGVSYTMYRKSFEWESDYGKSSGLYGDDNYTKHKLEFSFPFYDSTFDTLYISTNGWVDFWAGNNSSWWHHKSYPQEDFPHDHPDYVISPFGCNLSVSYKRPVWINDTEDINGKKCVITWDSLSRVKPEKYTFQLVIKESGEILFNYKFTSQPGTLIPRVGLNKGDGINGVKVDFKTYPITDGLTITFKPNSSTYSFIDREFRWIAYGDYVEISKWNYEKGLAKLGLPFKFDFYDRNWDTVNVVTNGFFYFNSIVNKNWYDGLPEIPNFHLSYGGYICHPVLQYYGMKTYRKGGGIYKFEKKGDKDTIFVVTTAYATNSDNVPKEQDLYTFQIVFYSSGRIMMNCKDFEKYSDYKFDIGVNYGDGITFTKYVSSPYKGLSILYEPIRYSIKKERFYLEGDYGKFLNYAVNSEEKYWLKTVTLPFKFSLFDTTFTRFDLVSNGVLDFLVGNENLIYVWDSFPSDRAKWAVAPLWAKYNKSPKNGKVFYKEVLDSTYKKVVITWLGVSYNTLDREDANNFQAVIYENGNIRFNYNGLKGPFTAIVGINENGENAAVYSKFPPSQKSLLFKPFYSDTLFYTWDFGDGSPIAEGLVSNSKFIFKKHTYTGVWKDYKAVLTIKDEEGNWDSDTTVIHVLPETKETKIGAAVEDGLRYLYLSQDKEGYWRYGDYDSVGPTGIAILAFANSGYTSNGDFDKEIYAEYLKKAEDWILKGMKYEAISEQYRGNPDSDRDGLGLNICNIDWGYQHPIAMMGFIGAHNPEDIAGPYGPNESEVTWRELIVDAVDYLAFGQTDSASGRYRGGWRYSPNKEADNSVTQWPVLALESAEREWGIYAPPWVKDELMVWLEYSQLEDGGFGYTGPDNGNIARTGAGICGYSYCGLSSDTICIKKAIDYLDKNWNKTGENGNFGNYYAMYTVMKGCRIANPPIEYIGGHNWYEEYSDYLLSAQRKDGSHPRSTYSNEVLSTAWATLILTPFVIGKPPVADAGPDQIVAPRDIVHFNGSGSYHKDTARTIVKYEWDFNNDGIFDSTGVEATYMWADTGKYYVTLRVWDDNVPPKSDIDVCIVFVTLGNHPPRANAGGPYEGFINSPVLLDGSFSYDPDTLVGDSILSYKWEIDGDGDFDDFFGKKGEWIWNKPFKGKIGLKVEDTKRMSDIDWASVDIVEFNLSSEGAFPDPFSPEASPGIKDTTYIRYVLSGNSDITIYILDIFGNNITTLGPFNRKSGFHKESWDGRFIGSGIYPYIIESNHGFSVKDTVEIDNIPPKGIILYPSEWDTITTDISVLNIIGTVTDSNWEGKAINFEHFVLEYGKGENPVNWDLISEGVIVIIDGVLGSLDITGFPAGIYTLRLKTYDKAGNEFVTQRRIIIVSYPDLLITSLTPFPKSAIEGDTIQVGADILNQGSLPAKENKIKFFLRMPENGELIDEGSVQALNPGENTSIEIKWWSKGYPGTNTIWAWVDAEDSVKESNENNNRLMTTVEITLPSLPDLGIRDIEFLPPEPKEGDIVRITGVVENSGISISNFRVNFYSDGSLIGSEIINDSLKTGETVPVEIEWDTYGWSGTHEIELYADPSNLIEELSEDNNTMSKTIIIGPSPIILSVTTDKEEYGAYDSVRVITRIENNGESTKDLMVNLKVKEKDELISTFNITLEPHAIKDTIIYWNTQRTFWGTYTVLGEANEGERLRAKDEDDFEIIPEISTSLSLFTNKSSYKSYENVEINSIAKNNSPNCLFNEVTLKIIVISPDNDTLKRYSHLFGLSLDEIVNRKDFWNTESRVPGEYKIKGILINNADGSILSLDSLWITLSESVVLMGGINVIQESIEWGEYFDVARWVKNTGNIDIIGYGITNVIDPVTKEEKDTVKTSISIKIDSTYLDTLRMESGKYYATKDYLVSFVVEARGEKIGVGIDNIRILDVTAPLITETISPVEDEYYSKNVEVKARVMDDVSGVKKVEYRIDGLSYNEIIRVEGDSINGVYEGSWESENVEDGEYILTIRAEDKGGNNWNTSTGDLNPVEVRLKIDNTEPITTLHIGPPHYLLVEGSPLYITSTTPLSITGEDVEKNNVTSGVDSTYYRIDDNLWNVYAGGEFKVRDEGIHVIEYYSVDRAGNREEVKSTELFVDNTPPVTTLIPGTPSYEPADSSQLYISSKTALSLKTDDVGCGVDTTYYRIDDNTWNVYTGVEFNLVEEGTHIIEYYSVDKLGNREEIKSRKLTMDNTPPLSYLVFGEPKKLFNGILYISPETPIWIEALDTCGIASFFYAVSTISGDVLQPWTEALGSFNIPYTPPHYRYVISYYSVDNLGNAESPKDTVVAFDCEPPITTLHIGLPRYPLAASGEPQYITSATPLSFEATDDISGVDSLYYRIDGGIWIANRYPPAGDHIEFKVEGEGIHFVEYYSIDRAGNREVVKIKEIRVDNTPPISKRTLGEPQFDSLFISSKTPIVISSFDPISLGVASGIWEIYYRINEGSWEEVERNMAEFSISGEDGVYKIEYYGKDHVENAEKIKEDSLKLDNTVPFSTLKVGEPYYSITGSPIFINSETKVEIISLDPEINGVSSGLNRIEYYIDNEPFKDYDSGFSVIDLDGLHKIYYRSIDNVNNVEDVKDTTFYLDNTAPVTSLDIGEPHYLGGDSLGLIYLTSLTPITLLVTDGEGSGVKSSDYQIDDLGWVSYDKEVTFDFSKVGEGMHILYYRSIDNLGNEEEMKSFYFAVDNTPPISKLISGEPSFELPADSLGRTLITSRTPLILTAIDPISSDVASGVKEVEYIITELSAGSSQLTATMEGDSVMFTITGEDGSYKVDYRARDNVLNLESFNSRYYELDNTPPLAMIISPLDSTMVSDEITIIGTAKDSHFKEYVLEYGIGLDPTDWNIIRVGDKEVRDSILG